VKVLHVIPSVSLKHGGPSIAVQSFAKASQQIGIEVTVATTDDDGNDARLDVPLGMPVDRDGVRHIFFRRDFVPYKVSFGLAKWLNRNVANFDVVHIHALFSYSSYAAARAARKHKIPYVVRPLGVLNRWGMKNRRPFLKKLSFRFIELPILRGAATIHYTTEAERNEANSLGLEVAGFPSVVMPVPVEAATETGDPNEYFRRFPEASGRKIILFLSRLDRKKGLDLLFRAFVGVRAAVPNSLLVVAGTGNKEYVKSLHQLADELRISDNIVWAGHLAGREKAAAFAAANVYVLPSYSENFGIAAAEAMAAGVPTVITDQVALAEYAAKYDAASVVRPDSEELAKALCAILRDKQLAQRFGNNGRGLIEGVFSPRVIGTQLHEMYGMAIPTKTENSAAT
jgi:glycosyltransferase involved in cell wall biosynthesis